jgi:hypothetical protein
MNGTPGKRGKTGLTGSHRRWMIFFCAIIVLAGVAFSFKLYEFFYDLGSQEGFRFAGAHLGTYLLVAGGFFLLLLFAFLNGHFSDIERPKHEILESEERHDRAEYGA